MSEHDEADPLKPLLVTRKGRLRYLWIAGLLFYFVALWLIGWEELKTALASIQFKFVLGFLALETAALWIRVLKWRIALAEDSRAVGLCFISKAGGNLSPARIGEFAPLLVTRKNAARIAAWITMDRILETVATLVLGLMGLAALGFAGRQTLLLVSVAALALIVVAGVLLTRKGIFDWGMKFFKEGSIPYKALHLLSSVSGELVQLAPKMPLLSAITFVTKVMDLGTGLLLFLSFGYTVGFDVLAVAQTMHVLASALPITPNATGVPYAIAAAFIYQVAALPTGVLAAAVPVRMALASAVFWISFGVGMSGFRRDAAKPSAEGEGS